MSSLNINIKYQMLGVAIFIAINTIYVFNCTVFFQYVFCPYGNSKGEEFGISDKQNRDEVYNKLVSLDFKRIETIRGGDILIYHKKKSPHKVYFDDTHSVDVYLYRGVFISCSLLAIFQDDKIVKISWSFGFLMP